MQEYAVFAARDLAGISAARQQRADHDGIAGAARLGGEHNAITNAQACVGGEPLVNGHGARGALHQRGQKQCGEDSHLRMRG